MSNNTIMVVGITVQFLIGLGLARLPRRGPPAADGLGPDGGGLGGAGERVGRGGVGWGGGGGGGGAVGGGRGRGGGAGVV